MLPAALSTVTSMFPEGAERNKALGSGAARAWRDGRAPRRRHPRQLVGWQYIFFFNVPIGAAALALAPKMLPESRPAAGRAVMTSSAPFDHERPHVFVYAISQAPQAGWAATQTVAMLAAGAVLLALFLVSRLESPRHAPTPLFRVSSIAGSNAVGFLLGASWTTFVFVGILYMQQVLGFSALAAGAAWTWRQ